jgi:hypothetical protein
MRNRAILLLLCFNININNFWAYSQNKSLEKYYSNIYLAEECILKGSPDSSLIYYSTAFTFKPYPFSRDIYNAAVVADKTNQNKIEYKYLKLLIARGVSCTELAKAKGFNNFFHQKGNERMIRQLQKQRPQFSKEYRKEIETLIERDQFFRIKPNGYKLFIDTILKIDAQNVNAFQNLIKKYGYPSEDKIGVDKLKAIGYPLYSGIILHQASGPMQQFNLTGLIKENILNGNLENKIGFFFLSRINGEGLSDILKFNLVKVIDSTKSASNPANIIIIDSTDYGYLQLSQEDIFQKNTRRLEFYLDDYESSLKKSLFSLKHPEYKLNVLGSTSNGNYTKREDYEIDKKLLNYQ